jgi:hypothetical protein
MIFRMRAGLGVVVVALCLQLGCDKERRLVCGASIDQACADSGSCVLSWDEARIESTFCEEALRAPPLRIECGAYHVASLPFIDYSRTYYYDAVTGSLVAIVTANAADRTTTCEAGPAGGFVPPVCTGAGSETLVCFDGGADAGTDGAAD